VAWIQPRLLLPFRHPRTPPPHRSHRPHHRRHLPCHRSRRAVDYESAFDAEGPGCPVPLETDADVGVLQSKGWLEWDAMPSSPLAGTSPILRIQSQVFFKDKTAHRNHASISGDISTKALVKVGSGVWPLSPTKLLSIPLSRADLAFASCARVAVSTLTSLILHCHHHTWIMVECRDPLLC
jgi:hypothetical protein